MLSFIISTGENMIQVEIIEGLKEKEFVEDMNYFLEKLSAHQLIDIKFNTYINEKETIYRALIIYNME